VTLPTIPSILNHEAVCAEIEQWVGPRQIYPISFSIPEQLILNEPPEKKQSVGEGISRSRQKYRFGPCEQQAYYKDYQRAYFGLTYKKGGWDCMRHLEIMANGTLPFFPGIEDCPRFTMAHYPKALIRKIYNDYASAVTIDDYNLSLDPMLARGPMEHYCQTVREILDHTLKNLTTVAMAQYVLDKAGHSQAKNVLYISGARKPDYLCDMLFHGIRSLLGGGCVDVEKIWWMYHNTSAEKVGQLYGHGFTYSRHLPDLDINRNSIKQRIAKHEFDLVVFGSVHRCHELLPHVRRYYERDEVVLVDGEDHCRLVGYHRPKRSWLTARKLPRGEILKQGIYFKREIDHATLISHRQA